jgi:hypothetical protein
VLETLLAEDTRADIEVLNAGIGGTGPHSALALLNKHADLAPDLFIATLFVGNDFAEALRHSDLVTGRVAKQRDAEYFARAHAAAQEQPVVMAQGFNQAYLFRYREGDADVALDVTLAVYLEIERVCRERGVELLVVVLPTKVDVDADDAETIEGLMAALDLSAADWESNADLARRFCDELTAAGIDCLDPSVAMAAEPRPLYWRADHHLNPTGHRLVAEAIRARVRDRVIAGIPETED